MGTEIQSSSFFFFFFFFFLLLHHHFVSERQNGTQGWICKNESKESRLEEDINLQPCLCQNFSIHSFHVNCSKKTKLSQHFCPHFISVLAFLNQVSPGLGPAAPAQDEFALANLFSAIVEMPIRLAGGCCRKCFFAYPLFTLGLAVKQIFHCQTWDFVSLLAFGGRFFKYL